MKRYGLNKILKDVSFSEVVTNVTAAMSKEGFGITTTIDMKATFEKKLDIDFRPYTILGACNPALAYQALEVDSEAGLLLPCNVVVQDLKEGVSVSIIDPQAVFVVAENGELDPVAEEVDLRLHRVLDSL